MRKQCWNYLDTVEVIGSIPVAPIVPFLNHIKPLQPFNSPSSTPVPPQFGNNLGTIKNVPIVPVLFDGHPAFRRSQVTWHTEACSMCLQRSWACSGCRAEKILAVRRLVELSVARR